MTESIHRQRVKGWKLPPNTICVTRPGPWGNPFRTAEAFGAWMEDGSWLLTDVHYTFRMNFAELWQELVARREFILQNLHKLKGKNLACFCPLPESGQKDVCHREVLMALANK